MICFISETGLRWTFEELQKSKKINFYESRPYGVIFVPEDVQNRAISKTNLQVFPTKFPFGASPQWSFKKLQHLLFLF